MRILFLLLIVFSSFSSFAQTDSIPVKTYKSLEQARKYPDKVIKLDLTRKKLKHFPPEILKMTNLKELYLPNNSIKELPFNIDTLKNLEIINFSNNKISALPPNIGNIKNLREIRINRNELTTLPPEIGNLSNLEILDMWSNEVDSLPNEIQKLTNLKVLELRNILITDEEQAKIKALLPNTKVHMSPSCNCKY